MSDQVWILFLFCKPKQMRKEWLGIHRRKIQETNKWEKKPTVHSTHTEIQMQNAKGWFLCIRIVKEMEAAAHVPEHWGKEDCWGHSQHPLAQFKNNIASLAVRTYLPFLGVGESRAMAIACPCLGSFSDNPDQNLKRGLLMAGVRLFVRSYLAFREIIVSPDGKISFKLIVYIYTLIYMYCRVVFR